MNPHLFSGLDPHTKHMIVTQIVVGIYNKTSCTDPGQYLQTYHDVWEKFFPSTEPKSAEEIRELDGAQQQQNAYNKNAWANRDTLE
ncbi:MAG: hypothetical protein IPP67_06415 [Rhodospirillaceae bacterium]|nr:hypothetical protein [Rhodospirillaceae bacterium]